MGSVKEEITRLETAKKDIETAIETCGVNVPDTELIDTYASYIRQIPSAVFSGLNVDPVGGSDQFIQSIKQTNGLIEATVGGLVSTSSSGLVPKADGNAGVINSPSDDYVLTYKGGTIDWYKLPANAFKNDDNNTTYTLSGALNGNAYDVTLTPSSGSATGAKVPAMGAASSSAAGTAGLVPAPAKNKHNSFLRGDGTWAVPDNTTYSVMTGATASAAGKSGLVPQPAKGDQGKFLSGAGTWTALPSLSITDSESGNAVTDVEVSGHGITLKRGTTFSVNGHKHSSDDITALTSYIKATTVAAIASTDSLNTALGKLELKADTAYNLVKGAYDGDGTIENLTEILKVLEGISDTDTIKAIIGKYLPLAGGTMTGNVTWKAGTGLASCFPAHIYRNTYDNDGNVYDHYYKSDTSSTNSFANLRVKSGTSFKLLRFGGDGTFTWDNKSVSLAGHTHTKAQITDFAHSHDYLPLTGGIMTGALDLTNSPNSSDGYKMGATNAGHLGGGIHFKKNGVNDWGQAITWSHGDDTSHAGIYVKSSGAYGTKMYLCTTNLFVDGAKAALEIDAAGKITALRNNFVGNLTGNASTADIAAIAGDGTITVVPQYNNEINFGGTNASSTLYFGYRATGSKPIPTAFVFGGSSGSASITASKFIKSGGTSSQFLKADGSVDSNTYVTGGPYLPLSGGSMNTNAKILAFTPAKGTSDKYNSAIELREATASTTSCTDNMYDAPGITFHWGGWWVHKLNLHTNDLYWDDNKVWHAGNDGAGSGLDADLLDGYHANSAGNKPWGTIPVVNTSGWMEIGKHLEFHYDNTTGSDYSTVLACTGNHSNVVSLPSASGTLALTSQIPTKTSQLTNDSGFLTQHQSLANYVTLNTAQTISATKTFSAQQSFTATGKAPFTVSSNVKVDNLNADLIGGYSSASLFKRLGWNSNTTYTDANTTSMPFGLMINQQDNYTSVIKNYPTGYGYLLNLSTGDESNYSGVQIYTNYNSSRTYIRSKWGSTWYDWKTLAYTSDIPTSLPANGGNSDTVDNLHATDFVKFYLSPMTSDAPADSAKTWFKDTMPAASGAIVYNVPGSEKTIIAGKSSGACGHMLQLNYDDTYLRILRYAAGTWKSTDWEKISAGYADKASSLHYANIGGGTSDTHDSVLKAYFNSKKASIPRDSLLGMYSGAYGNGSYYMGYFLSGYDSAPYGGFFVAHYGNPYYVGISNGNYTTQAILTSTNYTNYTVQKDGTGATGTWGINISGIAASASSVAWGNVSGKPSTFTPSTHTHTSIVTEGDNRAVATKPTDYSNNFVFRGLKNNSTIGIPTANGSYSYLVGLKGWSDKSGGGTHELAFNDGGIFRRSSTTSADTWGNWLKLLDSSNYTDYTVKKDGTGATGTWAIDISGKAADANTLDGIDSTGFLRQVTQNATFSSVANISTDLVPGIHSIHISGVEYSSILTGRDFYGSYWQLYFHPSSGYTHDIKYRATNCTTWKTLLDSNNWSSFITIPSVGNGTVTINQAGASKGSFTLNQSTAATIDLTDTNYYPTVFSWTGGTTSGPTGSLTGTGMSPVSFGAIPSASGSASGIVTTSSQTFAGEKTFHQIRLRQPYTSGSVNYGGYLYFGDGSYAYIAELSDDELYYHASGGHYFEGLNHNFAPVLVGTIYRKPGETTYSITSNSIGIDSSSGATKNIGISVSRSRAGKYAVTLTNNTPTPVRIHAPVITSSHGDWGGGSCYESPFAYLDHNSTCVFPKSLSAGKTLSFNIICGRIHTQGNWSTGDFTKSDDNSGFICSIYASYSGNTATG